MFFPSDSDYSSMLLTTATFGVGFFLRPIGGILIGIVADRRGRRSALQLIILLTTVAIAMIAFAPPFAAIGVAASLIIVIARMLQDLATGGEFASATAFLIEIAPLQKRGLYGSWQMVGQGLAMLGGAGITAIITRTLSNEQLHSWGWRLPFFIGLLIAPVGFWIRRNLQETVSLDVKDVNSDTGDSATRTLSKQWRALLCSLLLTMAGTIFFYVLVIYMPTFANKSLEIGLGDAFAAQCVGILVMVSVTPLFGAISDRMNRRLLIGRAIRVSFAIVSLL